MTRTTPPRPFDVAAVFPELREHSATVTRLHPRPGSPSVADSSVGGPLLWPAAEPWPHCSDGEDHHVDALLTPAAIRRTREILTAAKGRDLTEQERKILMLVAEGLTNREIAGRMFLAEKTVKNYVSSLLAKLGLERRTQAAVLAAKLLGTDKQH